MPEKVKSELIENEQSSKKIKLLEDEIVKLKQNDKDAQVMSEEMNEKMMDRVSEAEELTQKVQILNKKYSRNLYILNKLKKKRKFKKYIPFRKHFIDTAQFINIESDILSGKLVDIVTVPVVCFKYKNDIFMFTD